MCLILKFPVVFRVAFIQGKDEVSWEEKCADCTPPLPRPFLASCTPQCCSGPNLSFYVRENWRLRRLRIRFIKHLLSADACSFTDKKLKPREVSGNIWRPVTNGRVRTQSCWESSPHSHLFWESQAWLQRGHVFSSWRLTREAPLTGWFSDGRKYTTTLGFF